MAPAKKKGFFTVDLKRVIAFIIISCIGLLTWLLAWGHTEVADIPKTYSTKIECKENLTKVETNVSKEVETLRDDVHTLRSDVKSQFQQQQVYISDGIKMLRDDIKELRR